MDQFILQINNSKLLSAITMLTMNICGRYFSTEFPSSLDNFAKNKFIRIFIIFSFCFIATRDILYSIMFVLIILILSKFLLNDKSVSYILSKDKDNYSNNESDKLEITNEDYKKALFIIENYKK